MAKATKTEPVNDLNAKGTADEGLIIDELNAGGSVQETQQHDEKDGDPSDDEDTAEEDDQEEAAEPEFVVLKGNCIRHDGEVYRENSRIPVSGKDAERLLAAGVIADVQVLRQRALSAARGVKITTE
ncbi:TPA: hypothetical protein ACQ6JW_003853 [Klebsiella pneumoniae]|uniref:hypothetical protein n=1 Tax=Klebsiella TaxID=570 RepID=UPI000A26CB97|nr:hypothetical protein [Klebsiella pneumoniae]HBR1695953.1 hypothetical protein [Klebsiella quasipneumoniae subsp. quasipneumoniae]HBZ3706012.1 hypothetical protein [Klebsiella quasipneumoniae]MBK2567159.1 hypothetical protein [Klebsiella pneumoniae]UZI49066.1 hypothetical protein JMW73_10985 [Klebsiella pneumoniae]UZI62737.1 hypothetical protein JMV94_27085 [Klebsiella pneumoniae]